MYFWIHKNSAHNKIKQFRYKLINNIIATKENLKKWKISESDLCSACGYKENIEHFLLGCKTIKRFWNKIKLFFSSIGYSEEITNSKSLIVGYKPGVKEYNDINYILYIISYTLHKSYYKSDTRTIYVNILSFLRSECRLALNIIETNHNSKIKLKLLINKLINFI